MPEMSAALQERTHTADTHAERILDVVGLTLNDLAGKTVIDVGSGARFLERKVAESGMPATVISFDNDLSSLRAGSDRNRTAVQGNAWRGLPFKDQSADLLISVGGPIKGGPYDDFPLRLYEDALRVLKPNGEIRVYNPYSVEGGLGEYLHGAVQAGVAVVSDEFLKEHPAEAYDEQGLPLPDESFWLEYAHLFSPEQRMGFQEAITDDLEEALHDAGHNVRLTLGQTADGERQRNPYLVIRKLSGAG